MEDVNWQESFADGQPCGQCRAIQTLILNLTTGKLLTVCKEIHIADKLFDISDSLETLV